MNYETNITMFQKISHRNHFLYVLGVKRDILTRVILYAPVPIENGKVIKIISEDKLDFSDIEKNINLEITGFVSAEYVCNRLWHKLHPTT